MLTDVLVREAEPAAPLVPKARDTDGDAVFDPVFETLQQAQAPGALALCIERAWLEAGVARPSGFDARVLQIHYKPFERARVVAEARCDDVAAKGFLFLCVYDSLAQARKRVVFRSRDQKTGWHGPAALLLADWRAVLWWLPRGPKLGPARRCFEPRAFADLLHAHGLADAVVLPDLVRYVPRKRALFRWAASGGGMRYLKCYAAGADVEAARNLALLAGAAASLDFAVPRTVFHDTTLRGVCMSEVAGVPFTGMLGEVSAYGRVGHALASLHRSALQPALRWTADAELRALDRAIDDMQSILPSAGAALRTLQQRLVAARASLSFPLAEPIHANLFGDQILVAPQGVGIVDWDDLAAGDPLYDLGRLVAHCLYVALQGKADRGAIEAGVRQLLVAYGQRGGQAIDAPRLRWHVAMALLLRAKISALRALSPTWADEIRAASAQAQQILDGHSACLPH